jgi:hypothetical protein
MRIWFDGEKGNPNDNVARLKVQELMRQGNTGVEGKGSLLLNLILAAVFISEFVQ